MRLLNSEYNGNEDEVETKLRNRQVHVSGKGLRRAVGKSVQRCLLGFPLQHLYVSLDSKCF